tara:strand:- start:197686 stop:198726 length:1041 start_codon:yes stop_codon:yes gene_type:complete
MSKNPLETITLQTVADAAGVSVSTASRALAGKAKSYRISDKTEKLVREAAERLGFRPSRVARSLRSQRTGLIGVVVPDISNPFFAAIAKEVTLEAEVDGYSVLLADSRESTETEQRLITEFLDRQIEALVVCPVGTESTHLAAADRSGIPVVLVDRTFPDADMVQVTSDHIGGAKAAITLLLEQGHRNIGILQGLPKTLPNQQRLDGVRSTLQSQQIPFDTTRVAGDNFTETSGHQSAIEILSRHPDTTALFAFSTPNAMGALRAAAEVGLDVPRQLSIVAFDDAPFAEFLKVPLSTISQDVRRLGTTAAKLVSNHLRTGKRPHQKLHHVDVAIIRRLSIHEAPTC